MISPKTLDSIARTAASQDNDPGYLERTLGRAPTPTERKHFNRTVNILQKGATQ